MAKRYKVYFMDHSGQIRQSGRKLLYMKRHLMVFNPERCNYTILAKNHKEMDIIERQARYEWNCYLEEKAGGRRNVEK